MDVFKSNEDQPIELIESMNMPIIGGSAICVPDLDKKPLWMHSISVSSARLGILEKILDGPIRKRYLLSVRSLSNEEDEKIKSVFETNLPDAFKIHLALNTHVDYINLHLDRKPLLVAMYGVPSSNKSEWGPGKSLLTAVFSIKFGWPIISFENIYNEDAVFYSELLKRFGYNPRDSFAKALEIIRNADIVKKTKLNMSATPKTLRECLDDGIRKMINSPSTYSQPVILCDMPGEPRENGRPHDIFDLFARESVDLYFYTNRLLDPKQMESKIKFFKMQIDKLIGV